MEFGLSTSFAKWRVLLKKGAKADAFAPFLSIKLNGTDHFGRFCAQSGQFRL
jgi:hypothetical protein